MYQKSMLCTKRVCYVSKEYVMYQKSMLCTKRVCYIPKEYVMYQKSMLKSMLCIKRVCYVPKEYVMHQKRDKYQKDMLCTEKGISDSRGEFYRQRG